MHSLTEYQEIVEQEIEQIKWPADPPGLYEPAGYMMSLGGKRIRPVLTLLSAELFGSDINEVMPAALAMEVFHNFTLVHDDLMDRAGLRRGKPTIHKKWGDTTAILSGDVMLVLAYDLLLQLPSIKLKSAIALFNDAAKKVCEGQQLDMLYESSSAISLDEYTNMIGLKTAALLAACLKMGALLSDAPDEIQENIYRFGYEAGIAFQVQDDLLDAYGTAEVFGKMIGGDIAANKKTYLTVKALTLAGDDAGEELQYLFLHKEMDAKSKICEVLAIYDSLGVKQHAEAARDTHYAKALSYLDNIPAPDSGKELLRGLAEMLVRRES